MDKRMFSSRIRRLWSLLSEQEKFYDPKNCFQKNALKDRIRSFDVDWILWGEKKESNDEISASGGGTFQTNDSPNEEEVNDTFRTNVIAEASVQDILTPEDG